MLVSQVHASLLIRCFLALPFQAGSSFYHFVQTAGRGRNRFHHRTAKLGSQRRCINGRTLFFVDIALVQRHDHRNAQLQQLCGKKQAAAQIGSIYNVDNRIGVFMLDIAAGDALFRGERRHGVCAGQINCDQLFPLIIHFLDRTLFFLFCNTSPVAHTLISAGQGIIHGRFTAVGIACKSNSHINFSSSFQIFLENHPKNGRLSELVLANLPSKNSGMPQSQFFQTTIASAS